MGVLLRCIDGVIFICCIRRIRRFGMDQHESSSSVAVATALIAVFIVVIAAKVVCEAKVMV
eukprot:gene3888-6378_t